MQQDLKFPYKRQKDKCVVYFKNEKIEIEEVGRLGKTQLKLFIQDSKDLIVAPL